MRKGVVGKEQWSTKNTEYEGAISFGDMKKAFRLINPYHVPLKKVFLSNCDFQFEGIGGTSSIREGERKARIRGRERGNTCESAHLKAFPLRTISTHSSNE